jgi:hypothetical protein
MLTSFWITRGERDSSQWNKLFMWNHQPVYCKASLLLDRQGKYDYYIAPNGMRYYGWVPPKREKKLGYWVGKSHIPTKAIPPRLLANVLGASPKHLLSGGRNAIIKVELDKTQIKQLGVKRWRYT